MFSQATQLRYLADLFESGCASEKWLANQLRRLSIGQPLEPLPSTHRRIWWEPRHLPGKADRAEIAEQSAQAMRMAREILRS